MRKASKSREELLADLTKVFREHGFHGTTLSKLTQATGLERASLYHYFPKGKQDMASAVILGALESLENEVLVHLQTDAGPKEKLRKMLIALKHFYKDGTDQCFISIFSVGEIKEDIAAKLKTATESWVDLLVTIFHNLAYPTPNQEAIKALSSIQGSLVLSHITKDPEIFTGCLRSLANSWELDTDL
ncbi:MAG: TetR/AcrR family transcriptional regulator [Oligoflexales bacterium]